MPRLSVILPVYKADKLCLHKLINSLLHQTVDDIEIIIVYLKSEDGAINVIKSFDDSRIKFVEQKDKNGPGVARNIGINLASGDWLGFVEADDCVAGDFYEKLISQAKKDDADIICGNIIRNGNLWTKRQNETLYTKFEEKYSLIENGATFDKIFKADLIKQHSISFAEGKRWEDNLFIFKSFYFAKAVRVVPDAKYFYNPSPWSDEYRNRLRLDVIPATVEIMDFAKQENFSPSQLKLLQKKIIESFVNSFLSEKDIYQKLLEIMDNPLFLRVLYWKKRFKMWKKNIKQKIFRKEKK